MTAESCEVVIVGGGPAGLTAAIALAGAGLATTLVARRPPAPDHRTTALLAGSVTALELVGVWPCCRQHAGPLRVMRIVDDTARLLRAPEVSFVADEIGLDAFAQNIENRHLVAALEARARELAALELIDDEADVVEVAAAQVTVTLKGGGTVLARLAIGADGRHSRCRTAAGIEVESRSYPQTALTLNLRHSREHRDTSTEFHTEAGPFTLVPLPGRRSSLVFVMAPEDSDRLTALTDAAMAEEIERRSHSILGAVEVEPGRGLFPLSVATATRFGANRTALIGEAAHVIPPIGAQGLNLGLRDAASIAELVIDAQRDGGDVGAPELTDRYDRMRRADVASRTLAVDVLNRSLLSKHLPLQGMRGLSFYLLEHVGPLRRAVMREGVMPRIAQPRLMRGEAL